MIKQKDLFLLIDANSIFHRAYHALPRFTTKKGELVNAVYGFCLILLKALKDFKPAYFASAFDVAGPTFREEEYEEYKAQREKAPDELYAQIPRIKEILGIFNIPVYEKEGFEADDVIGTIVENLIEEKDTKVLIVSGDLDTLQLVNENVSVYTMKKSVQDTIIYTPKEVKERFGLKPNQLADYKGLRGDPSDNIPGVSGVGEKTASKLLQDFSTLEKLYEAFESGSAPDIKGKLKTNLLENKDQAFFSRMLATIRRDVPINFQLKDTKWGGFDPEKVIQLFDELNFRRLSETLSKIQGFEKVQSKPTGREEELLNDIASAKDAGIFSEEIYQLEKDLVPVILNMEQIGIGVDRKKLEELEKELSNQLNFVEKNIYKKVGEEFNINSPQQLSEVLFEKLHIDTKGLKKTPGKKISTAAGELEKLKGKHEVIDLILQQRELHKLLSTYITPIPPLLDKDGRLHTTYKPLGTATGRMSSVNPNLQNIPMRGDFAQKIRSAFVAQNGRKFLSCDYSQMELRVVAHLAQDKNMIEIFQRDEDIHVNTASLILGVPKEKVTPQMRYRAKALNFGIIYGIGPRAFAESAEISFEEAQEFIQRYLDVFEGIALYMEETKNKAHQLGYVETMFGRKRFLPDLNSPNPMLRAMAERAAINMPVQGTSADIVKLAMVETFKKFEEISLLLQIHDELLWEGEVDKIESVAIKIKETLENVVILSVPIKVDFKIGKNWGQLKI